METETITFGFPKAVGKMSNNWTAIVVTCPCPAWSTALERELRPLVAQDTVLLVVPDPGSEEGGSGKGVGSGGSTLNALLVVVEHLSARHGQSTVVPELLYTSKILILHVGPSLLPVPTCLQYISEGVSVEDTTLPANNLVRSAKLASILSLAPNCNPGILVASTDILLSGNLDINTNSWTLPGDIVLLTVPSSLEYATEHGVAISSPDGTVRNILYHPQKSEVQELLSSNTETNKEGEEFSAVEKRDKVSVLSGMVWFSGLVGESLLKLHCWSPLDTCTYMGVDVGIAESLQISLYYDILTASCSAVTYEEFVEGKCGKTLTHGRTVSPAMHAARKLVWSELRRYEIKEIVLSSLTHKYLPTWESLVGSELMTQWSSLSSFQFGGAAIASIPKDSSTTFSIQLDSIKDPDCKIPKVLSFGVQSSPTPKGGSYLAKLINVAIEVCPEGQLIQLEYPVNIQESNGRTCHAHPSSRSTCSSRGSSTERSCSSLTTRGFSTWASVFLALNDDFFKHYKLPESTFLGQPWNKILGLLDLSEDEVWPGIPWYARSLHTAKLFPVITRDEESENTVKRMSIKEASRKLDLNQYLDWRQYLHSEIVTTCLKETADFPPSCKYINLFKLSVCEGWSCKMLEALDYVALKTSSTQHGPALTSQLARLMAMTADLLGCMAEGRGGLRSGPAQNALFKPAFKHIEAGNITQGLKILSESRSEWLRRPTLLVRAARHYEGVVQLLVRQTVMSAQNRINVNLGLDNASVPETVSKMRPNMNEMVLVECPARLDLSGAWTDTPPICYEMGGKVVDLAIQLNGAKPIGCQASRIPDLVLEICLSDGEVLRIYEISQMADYCNPTARGALIKSCVISAGVVKMTSSSSLADQLKLAFGSGIRLEMWSNLPQGSGLGTSSILAGAVVSALWLCAGCQFNRSDVLHAVLVVEQLLTTGGGWQDQVGGLYPGLNLGSSPASFEVSIQTEHHDASEQFLSDLEKRLLVIYTGKPRLAKNLLQNVIRNWYSMEPEIIQCFKDNYKSAERCWEKAIKEENLDTLGECLSDCWKIKKILAPGSEPQLAADIFKALSPYIVGGLLAGAGGGGFLGALLSSGDDREAAMASLRGLASTDRIEIYSMSIDREGIVASVAGVPRFIPMS